MFLDMFAALVGHPAGGTFLAALAMTGLALLFPLRGGHGQHAHAGPGAVDVQRLRARIEAEKRAAARLLRKAARARCKVVPDEEIVWPEDDPSEHDYVGRHRLMRIRVDTFPVLAARIQLAPNFPRGGVFAGAA